MDKLLYVIGALFIGTAVLALPQVKSVIHQILVGLDFGFGFMIIGMGAVVQAIKQVRAA
jgi:hypothetical protein